MADRIIKEENERIAALTPLQLIRESLAPIDVDAPDFDQYRRKIVAALLA
jgi:hypothetical protein